MAIQYYNMSRHPVGSLTGNVPDGPLILSRVLDRLNIEADCWNGIDQLSQFHLIKQGGLATVGLTEQVDSKFDGPEGPRNPFNNSFGDCSSACYIVHSDLK